jgi:hypothetical protein
MASSAQQHMEPEDLSLGVHDEESLVEQSRTEFIERDLELRKSKFRIAIKKEASYITSTRTRQLVDSVREGK